MHNYRLRGSIIEQDIYNMLRMRDKKDVTVIAWPIEDTTTVTEVPYTKIYFEFTFKSKHFGTHVISKIMSMSEFLDMLFDEDYPKRFERFVKKMEGALITKTCMPISEQVEIYRRDGNNEIMVNGFTYRKVEEST